jgi:hypothetical protein
MRKAALAAALLLLPSRAFGVEKEHHVGAMTGMTILVIDDKASADVGAGWGLSYSYGLSDAFNFVAEGQGNVVAWGEGPGPTIPPTHPASVTSVAAGASYVFDIVRWIPHAALLAGGYVMDGGSLPKALVLPGFQLGVGLDYKFSYTWSAGIVYRQHMLLTHTSTYPSFSNVFARVEFAWGY